MPTARLYHNADCSKCRAALALLLERGVDTEVVNYLDHPPSIEQLRELVAKRGVPARSLVRTSEADAAHLAAPDMSDDDILAALHANPRWLQRPILVIGDRAVIARPAERVLELLDDPS